MASSDSDRPLNILLREMEQVRHDDRIARAQIPTLITASLTLITFMGWLYIRTCARGEPCPAGGIVVPIWVYIGAPLLPIILTSYIVLISATGTLRSYYLRVIERRIHQLTQQPENGVPIPSWVHLELEVAGATHPGFLVRANWFLIYGVLALMMAGCLLLPLKVPVSLRGYRFAGLAIDTTLLLVPFFVGYSSVLKGVGLWEQARVRLQQRLLHTDAGFPRRHRPLGRLFLSGGGERPLSGYLLLPASSRVNETAVEGERPLAWYLLLPRNREELFRALFVPGCFAIGRWLPPGVPALMAGDLWHFLGFFLVFEFLVYQARYLMNDVRDRGVDCRKDLSRRRFPCSWIEKDKDYALTLAFLSFLARLAVAVLIVFYILPVEKRQWVWHLSLLASVFPISVIYELARDRCNNAVKADARSRRAFRWTIAIVGFVGLGYGLRSLVGFWLAGVHDPLALLLLFLGGSLLGSTCVALGWALESTRAEATSLALGKGHLVFFRKAVSSSPSNIGVTLSQRLKALAGPQCLVSWWSAPAIPATVLLAGFALYVAYLHSNAKYLEFVVGASIGILAAAAAMWIQMSRLETCCWLTALYVFGLGFVLRFLMPTVTQAILAAVITGLPLIMTCAFRAMCFQYVIDFPGNVTKMLRDAGRFCRDTWAGEGR